MKITAEPRSDQWNFIDFMGGPRTFTIAEVKETPPKVAAEIRAKYDISLVEGGGRVWRPPLTVIRLLMAIWGDDGKIWVGRRVRLYGDPTVTSPAGNGGIRVSHLSHITERRVVELPDARGKAHRKHTVDPLPDAPAPDPNTARLAELRNEWVTADESRRAEITVEVEALSGGQ